MPAPLSTEAVLAHADRAARFYRHLINQGVPVPAAIQMACAFIGSCLLADRQDEPPAQPWDVVDG